MLVGDLGSLAQTRQLAEAANASATFDAVIHNAGIHLVPERTATEDGLPNVFQVNVLAPYLLSALMTPARRIVHPSSRAHHKAELDLADLG